MLVHKYFFVCPLSLAEVQCTPEYLQGWQQALILTAQQQQKAFMHGAMSSSAAWSNWYPTDSQNADETGMAAPSYPTASQNADETGMAAASYPTAFQNANETGMAAQYANWYTTGPQAWTQHGPQQGQAVVPPSTTATPVVGSAWGEAAQTPEAPTLQQSAQSVALSAKSSVPCRAGPSQPPLTLDPAPKAAAVGAQVAPKAFALAKAVPEPAPQHSASPRPAYPWKAAPMAERTEHIVNIHPR